MQTPKEEKTYHIFEAHISFYITRNIHRKMPESADSRSLGGPRNGPRIASQILSTKFTDD